MNIKKTAALGLPLLPFLGIVPSAHAATAVDTCPQSGPFSRLCNISLGQVIGTGITYVFVVAAIVALAFLIWGGLKWIISGGEKQAVQAAKDHIIAALIGLVVIFLSYVILSLVLSFFGISSFSFNLPNI